MKVVVHACVHAVSQNVFKSVCSCVVAFQHCMPVITCILISFLPDRKLHFTYW